MTQARRCVACERVPLVVDAERRKAPGLRTFSFRCECGARPVEAGGEPDAVRVWNEANDQVDEFFGHMWGAQKEGRGHG